MARNIGSVEVTVDANTGRLVAKARKDGAVAGSSYASEFEDQIGDIEGRELLAKLKLIRAKAEAELRNIEIDVGLDDSAARASLRALEQRLRAAALEVSIRPELETAEFLEDLQTIRAMVRDLRVDIDTEIDPAEVLALRELIDELLGTIEVEIEPDINTAEFVNARRRIDRWMDGAGRSGGGAFSRGFANSFSDGSEVALRAIFVFGDNVYAALEGTLGAAAGLASSLSFALGGAGGLAMTTISGLGAVAGASVAGMEGFGDALSAVNDEFERSVRGDYTSDLVRALSNLSPNARAAARAFGEIRGELRDARLEIQEQLFTGIDETIRTLARDSLPGLEYGFRVVAGSVNEFVRELAEVSNNTDWIGTFEALDPTIDNIFETAKDLAAVFPPMLEAAGPASERLSRALSDSVRSFRDWVNLNPSKLEQFFTDGANSLLNWSNLLASIGDLFGTIFSGGRGSGDRFVTSLDKMVTRWDLWLESVEGQTALDNFFSDAEQSMRDMEPFFDGLRDFITTLSEESGGSEFAGLMDSMGAAMPTIAEALALIGDLGIGETFLDMLGGLRPVFDLLNSLPDEALRLVGVLITVDRTMRLVSRAAMAMGVSLQTMQRANPIITGIGLALSGALFAYDLFSGRNREAEQAAAEFRSSLDNAITSVVQTQEAADPAAAAIEAMKEAFRDGGEIGERMVNALGDLGTNLDVVGADLVNFREGSENAEDALTRLAEAAGLPTEAARKLAEIVNSTDDNFRHIHGSSGGWGYALQDLAAQLGITEDEVLALARSMEAVQDEASNADLDKVAKDTLEYARGASAAKQAAYEQALEMAGLAAGTDLASLSTDEIIEVYQNYISTLYEAEAANQAQADALHDGASAYTVIQDQIRLSIEESQARAQALREERAEQFATYEQGINQARQLREAVADVATEQFGLPPGFAESVIELGQAWDAATEAASAFNAVMEVMRGGIPDLESAISNTEKAFRDAAEGITEMNEAGEEIQVTQAPLEELRTSAGQLVSVFDLGTESGAEFAGTARNMADAILSEAAAMIQAGESTEATTARVNELRQGLIDQIVAWGVPIELAAEYADTLLGTPSELNTAISQPGLIDALLNAEDLTLLYNEAGEPVITEFEALGLDPALAESEIFAALLSDITGMNVTPQVAVEGVETAQAELDATAGAVTELSGASATPSVELQNNLVVLAVIATIDALLDDLEGRTATPTVEASGAEDTQTDLATIIGLMVTLDGKSAEPDITLPTYTTVEGQLDTLQDALDKFDADRARPSITLPTFTLTRTQLTQLQTALDKFDSSTARPAISVPAYAEVHEKLVQLTRDVNAIPAVKAIHITTPGLLTAIDNVLRLRNSIGSLRDRSVTVTTNNVTRNSTAGAMAGELITGPTTRNVGEFGLAEAIVPLELPLERVDPSVRWMAELIRGEGKGQGITINQVIQPLSADPEAIAEQVANRTAARLS